MEFHISRQSRDKFQFDETLFALDGGVLFADFYSVRIFANKINQQRDLAQFPEQVARAGQINALGLMDEIFHYVFFLFRQQLAPQLMVESFAALSKSVSNKQIDQILTLFLNEFPPSSVYKKEVSADDYLESDTKGIPNRQLVLEEMILYYVTIQNPALDQYAELFTSPVLTENHDFLKILDQITKFFAEQPAFGPENLNLLNLLLSPAQHVPHSLSGQLEYIREHWASFLGEYFYRLLTSLDLLKEENKLSFVGTGPIPVPSYDKRSLFANAGSLADRVAFSVDKDWMPALVLIAKNTYVWLDQLSQKYQRSITHLDEIPQAELESLAQSGITGLWLIGLWERSKASAQIKQLCGNPDAIASAYSLYSYDIAFDLGGYAAYEKLRNMAASCGIRLASDMVPNHMGIDSDWVIHHPERFLALDECPYPNYSFTGPDLSGVDDVSIQIEDHYFSRSDAAVVFKRYDHNIGQTKYIYHGNDGTSMPWNDTAQLNYLSLVVQEAVYQTILEVARKFPIIRFDAAMTLAKKQVQRLWFPEPGNGGAIPSRSEHAMTHEQFEAAMPDEFWRKVVDRIAVDAPDTLLLAEAFWMMEGYFVRSLGMHRVYNSAFMHMLRDENNAGYRQLIKNTLEFEPEILKRYVNFMNNPDERTAVDQFGKSDKYFGVCMLMATFPGLPMLGHGQIEGYSEKYGMEYRHAYLNENTDDSLVERHRREIFPLLHKRRLFSDVENFWLFDFFSNNGHVNENVFAFTNHSGNERAFVVFNNNYQSTEGWINISSARMQKGSSTQRSLAECLGIDNSHAEYVLFRDQISGLEFIRKVEGIKKRGLHSHLNGYEYHAFYDFRFVSSDSKHDYKHLSEYLGENGIPNIEVGLTELFIQPILLPYRELVNAGYLKYLVEIARQGKPRVSSAVLDEAQVKLEFLLKGIQKALSTPFPQKDVLLQGMRSGLNSVLSLKYLTSEATSAQMKNLHKASKFILDNLDDLNLYTLIAWSFIGGLGKSKSEKDYEIISTALAEEWQLYKTFASVLKEMEFSETQITHSLNALKLITTQQNWYSTLGKEPLIEIANAWFSTPEILDYLEVNRFEGVLWYNREAFVDFLWWMSVTAYIQCEIQPQCTRSDSAETLLGCFSIIQDFLKADKKTDSKLEKLLSNLHK
ncbi:MAG: alpha-amylase family glycosyl hydrolase [Anaerolineaceae bacterium]